MAGDQVGTQTLVPADGGEAEGRQGEAASRAEHPPTDLALSPMRLPSSAIVASAGAMSSLTPAVLLRHLVLPTLTIHMLIIVRWLKPVAKNDSPSFARPSRSASRAAWRLIVT